MVNLSDNNGNLVTTYYYDVFGDFTESGTFTDNPYKFTGRRYDPESDLYFYRARMYSPSLGRFMQTDPVGYVDGPNLYTYVNNNPLGWIEPLGLAYLAERGLQDEAGKVFSNVGPFYHDQFFFEDYLEPTNLGFFNTNDGEIRPDNPEMLKHYRPVLKDLDDSTLRWAIKSVESEFKGKYDLIFRNCQTFSRRVLKEYDSLMEECEWD